MPLGPCFCKPGLMSQCTADRSGQKKCRFYEKSMVADKCMYCIENLNNHCDSHNAQVNGYQPDTVGSFRESFEEDLIDLTELVEKKIVERNCTKCILYACSYIIHENQQAQSRGGLNHSDLTVIANKCPDYDDEDTMQQKINQSLRGHKP